MVVRQGRRQPQPLRREKLSVKDSLKLLFNYMFPKYTKTAQLLEALGNLTGGEKVFIKDAFVQTTTMALEGSAKGRIQRSLNLGVVHCKRRDVTTRTGQSGWVQRFSRIPDTIHVFLFPSEPRIRVGSFHPQTRLASLEAKAINRLEIMTCTRNRALHEY